MLNNFKRMQICYLILFNYIMARLKYAVIIPVVFAIYYRKNLYSIAENMGKSKKKRQERKSVPLNTLLSDDHASPSSPATPSRSPKDSSKFKKAIFKLNSDASWEVPSLPTPYTPSILILIYLYF